MHGTKKAEVAFTWELERMDSVVDLMCFENVCFVSVLPNECSHVLVAIDLPNWPVCPVHY